MIKSGINPVKKDARDYSFNRTFGSSLAVFPDAFDLDLGKTMPDQNVDGFPEGCTGYTQAEICQDEDGVIYMPQAVYKNTCLMEGHDTTAPCEIRDSLNSLIVYGVQQPGSTDGYANRRGAFFNVDKKDGYDWFDSIRLALLNNPEKHSISVATQWFNSFERPTNGVLNTPNYIQESYSWHNWKISGWKTINGVVYLIGKSWQGRTYGDNGFHYVSRDIINTLLQASGSGAFTVTKVKPENIFTIQLTIYEQILKYLQKILSITKASMPIQTANGQKLYTMAKSLLGTRVAPYDASTDYGILGCAATVNVIANKALGVQIGGGTSTHDMFAALHDQSRFDVILEKDTLPGDIIISPTGYADNINSSGHVGIVAQFGILSNNSEDGKLEENYTLTSWRQYFGVARGFPVVFFRVK